MFSCIFRYPLFALVWMGLYQLCLVCLHLAGVPRLYRAPRRLSRLWSTVLAPPAPGVTLLSSWTVKSLLLLLLFIGFFLGIAGFSVEHSESSIPCLLPAWQEVRWHGQQATQTAASKTLPGPLSCAWWQLRLSEEPARKADGSSAVCLHFGLPLQQYSLRQQSGTKFLLSWTERKWAKM